MRKPVYEALYHVNKELAEFGLTLVVFDAYRPYRFTVSIWTEVKDDRYAANPIKGSGHNRGISVDLTLADLKTLELLPMPTPFDILQIPLTRILPEQTRNAQKPGTLKKVMIKYGFIPLSTEWWHFSWPYPDRYEVMDLSFDQLESLQIK